MRWAMLLKNLSHIVDQILSIGTFDSDQYIWKKCQNPGIEALPEFRYNDQFLRNFCFDYQVPIFDHQR